MSVFMILYDNSWKLLWKHIYQMLHYLCIYISTYLSEIHMYILNINKHSMYTAEHLSVSQLDIWIALIAHFKIQDFIIIIIQINSCFSILIIFNSQSTIIIFIVQNIFLWNVITFFFENTYQFFKIKFFMSNKLIRMLEQNIFR